MRKFVVTILFALTTTIFVAYSQDKELEEFKFETEEAQPESSSYFSVSAGYTATYNILNLDELNKLAVDKFGLPELKSPFFASGFEISTGAIIVKNLNVGFFNYSGKTTSDLITDTLNTTFDYKIENLGLTVDYGFVPFKSFAVLPGFQLGFARSSIDINRTGKQIEWNNIGTNSTGFTHKLEKSFLNLEPRVSVQYAVTNFLMFRAIASYALSIDNPFVDSKWSYNNSGTAMNVPSGINQSGLKIQFGIFVGLMNF